MLGRMNTKPVCISDLLGPRALTPLAVQSLHSLTVRLRCERR
jgi:hypothetical protein